MKRLFITLTLTLLAFMANAQSCPDNNHPHAIDLGLPSGTKWACCNVGATAPEGRGSYYAWGETEEKEKYEWTNYTHCDGSIDTCHDLGSDIAGTEYDVAHVKWGNSWVMPSQDQIKELASNCSCTWTRINGVYGDLFTGPNGSTVFLPEASFWRNDGKYGETDVIPSVGYYWSSTLRMSYTNFASYLSCSYGNVYWDIYNARCMGITVRPVISKVTAKETSYHPFVERAKRWCVHGFSMGGDHTVTDYYFSPEKNQLERNGHSYEQLCARTQDGNDKPLGWFREENRRVYMYNEEEDKEVLTYDFSLKEGDRFEPEYGDFEHCEVTKIDYLMVYGDSLKVINFEANDKTSDTAVRVNCRWIEGVGSEMNPLDGLFSHSAPNSWSYYLAYVAGNTYLPFSFGIPYNGWWGQDLARGEEDQDYARTHFFNENDLHYELVPDPVHDAYALHVSGIMWLYCGGDLYTYCRRERTEDISAYKLYLQVDVPGEVTTCKSPYHVELYFPFFLAEHKYIVVDERGEHPVAARETPYRRFVEEGKVWKVGWFPAAVNTAQKLDSYYFDGDSIIIDGKVCYKMRCRHEANERWGNPEPWSEYVGAFYEDGRKVFCVFPDKQELELLYDFESNIGDTIQVYRGVGARDFSTVSCIISKRQHLNNECFKGGVTYVDVEEPVWDDETQTVINKYNHDNPNRWMEGVGSRTPFDNIMFSGWAGNYYLLMSCTVGDEILYYDPDVKDGVTPPDGADVKKHWIDFTHIKKPRPKAPARKGTAYETDEENLTGEYSTKELFVNLKILSGAYTVTLKDAAGNEVYRREVQTSSTIALNTDLTKYPEGTYTLIVENSDEQYTATLTLPLDEVAVRDIPASIVNGKSVNSKYFDLSGRPLSTPPAKGIYIRDGKKVVR